MERSIKEQVGAATWESWPVGARMAIADAQATIAELMEALECVLTEKPLPSGEYVHLVSCNGDRRKPAGTIGVSCSCRVGRATIAALQARVLELEEWQRIVTGTGTDQESVIRLAAHEYTKAAIQCWKEANEKLTADLTQRTAECDALKLVNDTHMKTVMKLSHVVEQRTAELEAAMRERDHAKKMEVVQKEVADNQTWHVQQLRAELERVSLLSSHNERRFEEVDKKYKELRTLIAALPKVEGKIEVYTFKNTNQVVVTYNRGIIIGTLYGLDHAKPVAALYEHRQGMG